MTRWLAIIGFVLFLAGALFSGCDGATPPVAGPNISPNPPSEDAPVQNEPEPIQSPENYLFADNSQIIIPPIPATSPCPECNTIPDNDMSFTFKPNAIISSNSGAFTPFSEVAVQVILPQNFQGNSPLVGPVNEATNDQILPSISVRSNAEGSIAFGVYVNAGTTPGSFTFSATQGTTTLTLTLNLITQ